MSERRTVKTVLQYEVDQQSLRAATASADTVERALKGIDTDFSRLGSTVGSRVRTLQDRFRESIGTVREELALVQGVLGGASGGARGESVFARAGRFGREVRNLPAVQISGNLSTDAIGKLIGVTGTGLDKLGVSLKEFGGIVGLVTVGALAFTEVIDNLNTSFANGRKSLSAALEAQNNYYRALEEFTTSQVQAEVARLNAERERLIAQRDETNRAIQSTVEQVAQGFNPLGTLALIAGKTPIEDLRVQFDDLNKQIAVIDQTTARYTQGIEANTFAMNDAIAAQIAYENTIAQRIQQRSDVEAETQRFLETATRRSTDQRIETAQNEINRLLDLNAELSASGGETAEKLIELNNARILEQQFIVELTTLLRGVSDRRSDLTNAFNIVEGFFGDGIDVLTTGVDEVRQSFVNLQPAFETVTRITREQTESAAKLAQIAQQQIDAETKARNDRDRAREDAQYQLDRDLEDQAREHAQTIIDINRRANATIANSIGDRDALAAFLAENQRREDVRTERRNNREAIRRLEAHFRDQQRIIDRRYDEQLAAARSAAERATEIERARLQVQVDALNQQLVNQQTAANLQLQLHQETNTAILTGLVGLRDAATILFSQWEDNAAAAEAAYNRYLEVIDQQRTITGGGRAYGGAVNTGQRVLVGEHGPEIAYFRSPAMVMSNRASRSAGMGDMPITLNMVGQSDSQIARTAGREVEKYINRVMKAAKQRRGL